MAQEWNGVNEVAQRVASFWDAYQAVLQDCQIPIKKHPWFLSWVKRFISHFKGIPLKKRDETHVRNFLLHLEEIEKKEDWQLDQAQVAIEILYRDFLHIQLQDPSQVRVIKQKRPLAKVSASSFGSKSAILFERSKSSLVIKMFRRP